ncbi:H-NS histone family [Delftia tsuruhatensis]|uniref:H-NS histone family protein n=1 Tax=Delftia tsuruhatensis TaxID=180282 RepID=UPI001E7163B5|nr:H-NS histone family protein [Delftia tsuruhatensis]CAB5709441.1 H-NS histone family [Delftia tsuruhatensis]CAC9685301.1 H-NS histone family [Delftia tsuruhatensis]
MTHDYKTLLQQKAELEAQIAEVLKTEKSGAVAQARAIIQQYALTEADVFPSARASKAGTRVVGIPKYRDPASGATWTGRGKQPRWIEGKDRTPFII